MNSIKDIQDFLSTKKMAIAGVSRDKKKFGYSIFSSLKKNGYEILPVNPNAELIDETRCYASVEDLPDDVENLLIVTPKNQTLAVLGLAEKKGIKRVWLQQMSETPEAMQFIKEKNMPAITKKCIFMFAEPVEGFHKFHKILTKVFGKYPS